MQEEAARRAAGGGDEEGGGGGGGWGGGGGGGGCGRGGGGGGGGGLFKVFLSLGGFLPKNPFRGVTFPSLHPPRLPIGGTIWLLFTSGRGLLVACSN